MEKEVDEQDFFRSPLYYLHEWQVPTWTERVAYSFEFFK